MDKYSSKYASINSMICFQVYGESFPFAALLLNRIDVDLSS